MLGHIHSWGWGADGARVGATVVVRGDVFVAVGGEPSLDFNEVDNEGGDVAFEDGRVPSDHVLRHHFCLVVLVHH